MRADFFKKGCVYTYWRVLRLGIMLDVVFNNFPVGEVLPVQVVQVYATPAITNARIVALW